MKKGFTLIELLIVIGISSLLIGFVVASFNILNRNQALHKAADTTASMLREARSLTLASKNGIQYGVHFDTSQIVLFEGSTYSSTTASNVSLPLNSFAQISTIALRSGATEVIFDRLTGDTSQDGDVILSLISAPTTTRVITISATGLIEVSS